jgi:class 3 adenylate cyclase/DNA-binding winged helix-turn-helix (wHTH) protein
MLRFADFKLDRGACELRRGGQVVHLERIPLDLLFLLAERRGQLVARDEILERIWGKGVFLDGDASINAAIRKIRRALEDDAEAPRFIVTLPARGYRFIAEVREEPVGTAEPRPSQTAGVGPNRNLFERPTDREETRSAEERPADELDLPPATSHIEQPGRQPAAAPKKSDEPQIRLADTSALQKLDGERKTVTALFAEIGGLTDLIEDLDPEEVRDIVDPALKLMIDSVQHYDGYVTRSTGDGIFALFGAPVAREDHPRRALLAALRMQAEVKPYAEKLLAEKGMKMQVRVGADTGEVVVREIRTGEKRTEYAPIGHPTSVAARVQMLAAPGSIAISGAVRKLVEGYFTLSVLGPARIEGVSEPVELYEVTGLGPLRTRLQRSAGRGLTKFVGREHEMETMVRAVDQAQAGHGQIVAALGEPGVGKSRLLFEFKAVSQSRWMVLEGFSVSHGKASAYLPVIDLLYAYFDFSSEDDSRQRREKVTGRVLALDRSLEDTLPYLFSLLAIVEGVDPAQGEPQPAADSDLRRPALDRR